MFSHWYGTPPLLPTELHLLRDLEARLQAHAQTFMALSHFYPSAATDLDLVIIKPHGIIVAEIVWSHELIRPHDEEHWRVGAHEPPRLMPSPFPPLRRKYWEMKEWLRRNGSTICGRRDRAAVMNWRGARSFVVVYPRMPPGSIAPVDQYTRVLGFDMWLEEVVYRHQHGLDLTRDELARIPRLLGLHNAAAPRLRGESAAMAAW